MCTIMAGGCATTKTAGSGIIGKFRIVKVNRFLRMKSLRGEGFMEAARNQPNITDFQSGIIPFEDRGEEFVVTWRYDGKPIENVPVKLYFDYTYLRQPQIYRVEESYSVIIPGRHIFKFRNFGDDYAQNGQIEDWRVTLFYGDKLLHEKKSVFFGKD